MSVIGPNNAEKFLRKLDEKKLLDLCADILSIEGHTNIRITDGPGDGQRDIYSITPDGEKFLTQSKYHKNINKSVTSQEIGETISGMLRFGCKKGLFITTGKISPPAKRDLLESYPGYNVKFLEGWDIAKKVFENLVLKAIWYDGESLDRVTYNLVIPIIARDLEIDKPFSICDKQDDKITYPLKVGDTKANLSFRKSVGSTSVFGVYRSPNRRTLSELRSLEITLTNVVLSGTIN
jgi:hypothetical protein